MTVLEKLKSFGASPKHLEFAAYILNNTGDDPFPDYKKLDLMEIAGLVSNLWVVDFRERQSGKDLVHFSGTNVDAHYERNVTGLNLRTYYKAEDFEHYLLPYSEAPVHKRPVFSIRNARYEDSYISKVKVIEAVFFPCSGNKADINFGIGLVEYGLANEHVQQWLEVL